MNNLLKTIKKPYKIYADLNTIEIGALQQFIDAMKQEFVVKGALMPDAHQGYSLPIGGVVVTDGVIVPSYIGFDLGCGMCAIKTDFRMGDIKDKAQKIYNQIKRNIPVGFEHHKKASANLMDTSKFTPAMEEIYNEKKGHLQLGTLGGGKLIASGPRV